MLCLYKGHDQATMYIGTNQDEVKLYLDSQYVSGSESCWRIFSHDSMICHTIGSAHTWGTYGDL
ncbi:hypothetical protein GYMLUDRAFT_173827 [Collybiopsis luxurians FD-317 M1]|uniref:Uncharacterized protein n=1 Tax=Collybiopsis luxurians FD-317 M1 TaxID=944289 RepID=A0A0D0B0X7_9AGAR|nr:hypothetical protein GYMLUDRAFT_173827 [Collybiopsis luxurians FD-317 M1]